MAQRVVIPGFRKIETSGGGEGGTTNYNDLANKPSINNVPLVGNLNTVNLKLTDSTLTKDGEPTSVYPDANNHSIDAVRYGLEQVWKRKGK